MPYTISCKDIVEEENVSLYGTHSDVLGEILLAKNIKLEKELIPLKEYQIDNTFWHELFHAFQYFYNNEQDEALAQTFANFMCEFLESSKAVITFKQ